MGTPRGQRRLAGQDRLPLYALLAANLVSNAGSVLTLIAVPWFVLETTGSATRTGLTGFVAALPMIIAGVFGGALVDRAGFKRMSVAADLCSCATIALIPLLYATVGLAFWQLLALVFVGDLFNQPGQTARESLIPELAERAGMPLERAISIEQVGSRMSYLIGPPLAGVLIALLGAGQALWIDAATFLFSAAVVAARIPRAAAPTSATGSAGYVAELREGLAFLRGDALLYSMIVTVAILNFLDAYSSIVYPVYAARVYGSALALGLMFATGACGAVLSTILFAAFGGRMARRTAFVGGFILAGLPIWALGFEPALLLTLAALFVRGLGAGPLNPVIGTLLQERTPAAMRGRVLGLVGAISAIAIPIGRLLFGFLIDAVGLQATLLGVAAAYLAVTLSMTLNRALRDMDERRPAPAMFQPRHASTAAVLQPAGGGREL